MTDKEKAKAYDEALERAKKKVEESTAIYGKNCAAVQLIQEVFPELRESEDERIRKYLIEELKAAKSVGELKFVIPQPTKEECIAYLEKQKENPKSANSISADCASDVKCEDRSPKHSDSDGTDISDTPAYWKGWDDAMKQKEQKHPNGCFTCDEYKKGYEEGRRNGFTAGYNKAIKEVEQKEQKPKFNVGDTIRLKNSYAEYTIESISDGRYYCNGCSIDIDGCDRDYELVQQKPAEWSEEDEKRVKQLIYDTEHIRAEYEKRKKELGESFNDRLIKDCDEQIAWLKSLRPQPQGVYKQIVHSIYKMLKGKDFYGMPTSNCISLLNDIRVKCKDADECAEILDEPSWKPSEDQLKSLQCAIVFLEIRKVSDYDINPLKELYEQLMELI